MFANPSKAASEPWPLLEYYLEGGAWLWRGSLLGDPGTADEFAQKMQAAFAEVYEYLAEVHPSDAQNIRRVTLKSQELLEIETGGDDFVLQNKAGFPWVHIVGRYRPATVADFSRIRKRATKGSGASFIPIQDTAAWKSAAPRADVSQGALFHDGLSRVALSALRDVKKDPGRQHLSTVLFEKDGADLIAVATDSHRMSVHRFLRQAAYANLDAKLHKALVPLPAVQDVLRNVLKRGRDFALDAAFDFRRVGNAGTFAWTPQTPTEEAWQGSVVADGRDYSVPLLDPERFPNWRTVLPKAGELAWHLMLNAEDVAGALTSLGQDWKAAFAEANGKSPKAKDFPKSVTGWLHKNGLALSYEDPRGEGARLQQEVPGHSAKGLSRPVPFLANPKYLADALAGMGGEFLLSGYVSDTKGSDGETYLSKPLIFFDASGPTETLLMPMWPPR